MKEFRKLKNLEEIFGIKPGEIIGVGQLIGRTIPALCVYNDGNKIKFLGNINNDFIAEYCFNINEIKALKKDGSFFTKMEMGKDWNIVRNKNPLYSSKRQKLINANIWEEEYN